MNMTNDTPASQALNALGWETLQTQRAKSKAITMFKVLNYLAPSPLTELFVPKNNVTDYNLRCSSTSLQLSKPRTEMLKKIVVMMETTAKRFFNCLK